MAVSISCTGHIYGVGVTMWEHEFTRPPGYSVMCLDYLMDCSAFHGVWMVFEIYIIVVVFWVTYLVRMFHWLKRWRDWLIVTVLLHRAPYTVSDVVKLVEFLHTLVGFSSFNAGWVFTYTGWIFDHWLSFVRAGRAPKALVGFLHWLSFNAGWVFTYTGWIFEF